MSNYRSNPRTNSDFNSFLSHGSAINAPLPSAWTTLDSALIKQELLKVAEQVAEQATVQSTLPLSALKTITLHLYKKVTSTNEILWQHLQTGCPEGTVVMAQQQSAGRGQRGRQWQSERGGLYLSLALTPNLPAQKAAHLILCVVWGVAIALRTCHIPVGIKWPNDLVVQLPGAEQLYKLGGILTETRIQGHLISQAVVGIGINGANTVPEPGISLLTALSQAQQERSHNEMTLNQLGAIAIYGIVLGWHTLQHHGIDVILAGYNTLLVHRNHVIKLRSNEQSRQGQIIGVRESGALQVSPVADSVKPNSAVSSSTPSNPPLEFLPGTLQLGYGLTPNIDSVEA
ncbi:MAG: biotin--[acetyl-CoA-carboxylase] ligase [Merismopedia sp. SIO2A8]|nr:biotin--[acetyl-CoA-carboxylase] ligase [Symploca sp. SIO2B6]NET49199.1 biotin--[acetyl-CoA-carboxylase] ligase [Merismopedia sp. SIO2A8]